MVIVSTPLMGFGGFGTPEITTVSAISVKDANRGQLLWTTIIPAPSGNQTRSFAAFDAIGRAFVYFDKETISLDRLQHGHRGKTLGANSV